MASVGSVRIYFPDEGWGVIDGLDVPGGCWVSFSAIQMDGYRSLGVGQKISFTFERANQDGFSFRAVKVWIGAEPPNGEGITKSSDAYGSSLDLVVDDESEPDFK
jgi:cold shock protein